MKPTEKAPGVLNVIKDIFNLDRDVAIKADHCQPPPFGCGKPVTGFDGLLSEREFRISGLCQECQDEFFGKDE